MLDINGDYTEFTRCIKKCGIQSLLLVCGKSSRLLGISKCLEDLEKKEGIKVIRFSDFQPNPQYESVVEGVKMLEEAKCELIVAVGGGSAMDVAKCIKLYYGMSQGTNYLQQEIVPNDIRLWAVPTTAGTGSESTRYAVIYYNGEKQSITHDSCIPELVFMDSSALKTLPEYQRKVTMLDALCHAVESFWSVNSTEESKSYALEAIRLIKSDYESYLANEDIGNQNMLRAANLAGRAINISQTTAGHAMCYKLTSLYGISHGHAAAICVLHLWTYMIDHIDKCIDSRGKEYVRKVFETLNKEISVEEFSSLLKKLALDIPTAKEEEYYILKKSVNPVRLKNNPIALTEDVIDDLYHKILGEDGKSKCR